MRTHAQSSHTQAIAPISHVAYHNHPIPTLRLGGEGTTGPGKLAIIETTMNTTLHQDDLETNVNPNLSSSLSWAELWLCNSIIIQSTPAN